VYPNLTNQRIDIFKVVKRQPTQVSVSSLSEEHAERAAACFHQWWFRWSVNSIISCFTLFIKNSYTNGDPIGVELAGAGKNVYAIAAGLASGLGYENNARAGLSIPPIFPLLLDESIILGFITRSLAE
jgi:glycerol-3-phosphate dehydrogenase